MPTAKKVKDEKNIRIPKVRLETSTSPKYIDNKRSIYKTYILKD